jgi:hypothetical protein
VRPSHPVASSAEPALVIVPLPDPLQVDRRPPMARADLCFYPHHSMMVSIKSDIFKSARGSFERLNSENYPQWIASMKRLLKAEDLCEIVNGSETCPQAIIISGDISNSIRAYRKRQNEARVLLHPLSSSLYQKSKIRWKFGTPSRLD